MAHSIVSREELLENAYQIAEKNGVSALSVRGLANATGVSVGTVYRHFSAKDELTTAAIQLYFKHAFYERFCHVDPQVGFVDYCREMHASMCEATTHFRECWLRGIDALPAVEKTRRGFHTLSIGVWLVWLVPYFVGMLIGIPAFHVSDLVALAAAAGVVAVLALALLLTSKRSHA